MRAPPAFGAVSYLTRPPPAQKLEVFTVDPKEIAVDLRDKFNAGLSILLGAIIVGFWIYFSPIFFKWRPPANHPEPEPSARFRAGANEREFGNLNHRGHRGHGEEGQPRDFQLGTWNVELGTPAARHEGGAVGEDAAQALEERKVNTYGLTPTTT